MRKTSKPHPKSRIRAAMPKLDRMNRPVWADGQVYSLDRFEKAPKTARGNADGGKTFDSWEQRFGSFENLNDAALADILRAVPYRDAVCTLCEKSVALAFDIPVECFHKRSRSSAEVALARQIAMYLAHTTFSLLLTEIGLHFQRDRTTVSHACAMVEDKRDELEFDVLLTQLESLLSEARTAMAFNLGEILQHVQRSTSSDRSAKDQTDEECPQHPVAEESRRRA